MRQHTPASAKPAAPPIGFPACFPAEGSVLPYNETVSYETQPLPSARRIQRWPRGGVPDSAVAGVCKFLVFLSQNPIDYDTP